MSEAGHTNLLENISGMEVSPQFDGYTRVVVTVSDDESYEAGNTTGRTLEISCPWGTQAIANDVLATVKNFQYQPYTADGAYLDPAAELGDAVTVNGVYSGIYTHSDTFGRDYTADVSAPADEEIDHEYPFEESSDRVFTRNIKNLKTELTVQSGRISAEVAERSNGDAELSAALTIQKDRITSEITNRQSADDTLSSKITQTANSLQSEITARKNADSALTSTLNQQADEISAKVSKSGGSSSSFGWTLTDASWSLYADGGAVLTATKDGLNVKGIITATGGTIGGLDIKNNYLSYNGQTWGGTNTTGFYLGPSGLQLGKNFKVDMQGNLTAGSGTFTGSIYAKNISYGGSAGYVSGSALSGGSVYGSKLVGNTVTTAYTSSGINTSLGYADSAYSMLMGWTKIDYVWTSKVQTSTLSASYYNGAYTGLNLMYYGTYKQLRWRTVTIDGTSYTLLGI